METIAFGPKALEGVRYVKPIFYMYFFQRLKLTLIRPTKGGAFFRNTVCLCKKYKKKKRLLRASALAVTIAVYLELEHPSSMDARDLRKSTREESNLTACDSRESRLSSLINSIIKTRISYDAE
ncbi:MAG: hypothetical protein CMB73_05625 [Euryarchaeota archaeon]|nr:hypothetical protein [Euryarchaeota archaeon]